METHLGKYLSSDTDFEAPLEMSVKSAENEMWSVHENSSHNLGSHGQLCRPCYVREFVPRLQKAAASAVDHFPFD